MKQILFILFLDVFHWDCLNQYALKMPPNTAPAGYSCPTCKHGIFPASNLMSPVAESLRQVLKTVNWARAGLGLPLVSTMYFSLLTIAIVNCFLNVVFQSFAGSVTCQYGKIVLRPF